jgi:hypothetical protein
MEIKNVTIEIKSLVTVPLKVDTDVSKEDFKKTIVEMLVKCVNDFDVNNVS